MKIFTFLTILTFITQFSFAQNPVFNWEETELSESNLKVMAINDNSAVVAGYSNGFFKSTDGGESWDTLNLFNPAFTLFDISIKGNIGYIAVQREKLYDAGHDVYAEGFIMKTTDGGQTWTVIDSPVLGTADDPALSPSDTLCFGLDFQSIETVNDSVAFCALRWLVYTKSGSDTHAGIFKTSDGGGTWINVSGDLGNNVTSAISFIGETGFAGGNKHLYKLTTEADTAVDYFPNMPGDGSDFIYDLDLVGENEIYVVTTADSVYYSMDGGASFDKYPEVKGGFDVFKVNDSTLVVAGGSNKTYVSTDSGQTWANSGIGTSIWEIAGIFKDSLNLLAKAEIYKIAVTDLVAGNYNYSTQAIGNGNLQKAYIANENEMIIVGSDASFLKTTDGGATWIEQQIPAVPTLDRFFEEVDFDGLSMVGDKGYASFNRIRFVDYKDLDDLYWSGGIAFTEDFWQTWKFIDVAKLGNENESDLSLNPNHEDCGAINTGLLKYTEDDVLLMYSRWYDYSSEKTEHGRVFKTTDGGKNWTAITEDLTNHYVQDIVAQGDTLYVVGSQLFLKSTSAGLKSAATVIDFTNLYPVLDEGEDDNMFINALWADGNELFLVTTLDSCFMSKDGGETFITMSKSKGANDFYRFDNNSFMMLGSSGKSWFTNDATSWVDCHPGVTTYSIGGIYNGKIYGLARGSIYATSVADLDLQTSIPLTLLNEGLQIAYSSTTVDVISADKEIARIELYSISGKMISVNEPNNRIFRYNASDYQPGIYIVRSVVDGKHYANKIAFR